MLCFDYLAMKGSAAGARWCSRWVRWLSRFGMLSFGKRIAEREFFLRRVTWLSLYARESLAADAEVAAEGSGFRGFALAHNVRTREEVDATLAQAVAAGIDGFIVSWWRPGDFHDRGVSPLLEAA